MRNIEYLVMRYDFGSLTMIPPDLVNAFGDNNRNAVYKQDNVAAVCICAIGILPFVGNMEPILCNIAKIYQLYIYFTLLLLVINTFFAFQVLQNL